MEGFGFGSEKGLRKWGGFGPCCLFSCILYNFKHHSKNPRKALKKHEAPKKKSPK